jgi:AraC-like DNA-binding protein
MAFNLWWLFFSMAAGISLFGGLLLMIGSARQGAGTRALGFLLLVFSITLVDYVMFWSDNVAHFPHLSGLWQAGNYLYGPLLLAFYNKDISLAWKKWLPHFIPGLLLLFTWLPFGILPTAEKLAWMQTKYVFDTPLLLHRSLLYLLTPVPMVGTQFLYGLYFLWQSQAMENGERKWKRGIAVLFLVFVLAQLIYFVLIRLPGFKAEWDYMISLAMVLCIFSITLFTFHRPEYFFNRKKRSPLEGKYNSSSLTSSQSASVALQIKSYVEQHQSYLQPDLRLPQLAKVLGLYPQQVSQAINEHFHCSFSEWINTYRIEHACQLLSKNNISAKEAGYQSGFNSLSAFYQVFKKEKGISPAAYFKVQS